MAQRACNRADGGTKWSQMIPRLGRVLDVEIAQTPRVDLEIFVVTERGVVLRSDPKTRGPFGKWATFPRGCRYATYSIWLFRPRLTKTRP
jgi:hypothetical protein